MYVKFSLSIVDSIVFKLYVCLFLFRPAALTFSLQVLDSRRENPLVSQEKETQSKRIAHVLEVRLVLCMRIISGGEIFIFAKKKNRRSRSGSEYF
jgi:hypothetical protein